MWVFYLVIQLDVSESKVEVSSGILTPGEVAFTIKRFITIVNYIVHVGNTVVSMYL